MNLWYVVRDYWSLDVPCYLGTEATASINLVNTQGSDVSSDATISLFSTGSPLFSIVLVSYDPVSNGDAGGVVTLTAGGSGLPSDLPSGSVLSFDVSFTATTSGGGNMSSPVNFAGMWRALPGIVNSVSYVSVGTNSGYPNVNLTLSSVVTTPRAKVERAESYGKYIQRKTTVKIPKEVWTAAIGTRYPKSRDQITLYSTTWTVCKSIDETVQNGLYRLEVDYFEPQFAIDDTVQFLNASCSGASSTGDRVVADTAIVTNYPSTGGTSIPAAIEPIGQDLEERFGAMTMGEAFDIYLSRDVSAVNNPSIVKAGALIQDQNGVQYEVLEVTDRERLDLETRCVCIKKL